MPGKSGLLRLPVEEKAAFTRQSSDKPIIHNSSEDSIIHPDRLMGVADVHSKQLAQTSIHFFHPLAYSDGKIVVICRGDNKM